MFTVQDIRSIARQHLDSEEFEVLKYEVNSDESLINVKILKDNEEREVKFGVKQLLNEPKFPGAMQAIKLTLDFGMIPTYFIKENVFTFEDLSNQGFVANSLEMDLSHIKVVLGALAKYHGLSIGFEEKKSTQAGKSFQLPDENHVLLQKTREQEKILQELAQSISQLIKLLPETEFSHEEYIVSLSKIINNSLKRKSKVFRKVLCCGYVSPKSVLFKYKDGLPAECKLLNFNSQHYSAPAHDALQFIYLSTSKAFRQHHLHDLLEFYYKRLENELAKVNLVLDKLLSVEDFEVSVHHLLPLIKLQTVCTHQSALELDQSVTNNHTAARTKLAEELKNLITYPELTPEDCFKIIKNKIGTTNYDLVSYQIVPIGKVSGFFGEHKKLKIKIQIDNELRTLNFFVKFTPKGAAQKSIADDFGSFYKENFFYRHFVAKARRFASLIDDCTVPCYFTRLNDVMVFEDFEIRNYGILNHRRPLSYEVVEIIVKRLAKLHASSIILEEKLSEETGTKFRLKEHYSEELKESFFTKIPNHQGTKSTAISIEAVKDEIRLFPAANSPQLSDETFREKLGKAYDLVFELVKPSNEFRNVICHGDLWINNILVQQVDGAPQDCRLIDFQIVRYCPPAHDLLGFIYLATDRGFRSRHMQKVIDLYYEEFAAAIGSCGCDVETIYSRENFRKSVDYMLPESVCQTAIYYQICLTDPDLMKHYVATEEKMKQIFLVDRRDFIAEMCERDPIYKERNKEAVEDLRDLCSEYF